MTYSREFTLVRIVQLNRCFIFVIIRDDVQQPM